jgi:NTE family protein
MDEIVSKLLSKPLYQKFNPEEVVKLLQNTQLLEIDRGTKIITQGDPAEHAYIVVEGKLAAVRNHQSKQELLLGIIHEGEMFGELGVIQSEERICSVIAQKKCVLLSFKKNDLINELDSNPVLSRLLCDVLISRFKNTTYYQQETASDKSIYLCPYLSSSNFEKIIAELEVAMAEMNINYLILTKELLEGELGKDLNQKNYEKWIKDNHQDKECILFLYQRDECWGKFCVDNSDRSIYVADLSTMHSKDRVKNIPIDMVTNAMRRNDLIILTEDRKNLENTPELINDYSFTNIYTIDRQVRKQMHRFAKVLSPNKAVGLVLGGGGVRGWVHVGVLKALKNFNIDIDYIGGSSIGAISAFMFSKYDDYQQFYDAAVDLFKNKGIGIKDWAIPKTAFTNAKFITNKLKLLFGSDSVETLKINSFAIAYNLSQKSEVVFSQGEAWKIVRASLSIPAVFPPVTMNGDLIIDGSVINTLPVDVMLNKLSNKGTVIAVDLSNTGGKRYHYDFPPILTTTDLLKNRFIHKQYKLPSITKLILKTMFIGSSTRDRENGQKANILIQPNLCGTKLLASNEHENLIELGYREASCQIENHIKKGHRNV